MSKYTQLSLLSLLTLLPCLSLAQSGSFALGSTSVVVGPASGSASVELLASSSAATWTATSNAAWLSLAPASTSGTGSALIQFSYAANPGPSIQTGTMTIAGLNLTVTQAGGNFAPTGGLSTLIGQGLSKPYAVALDSAGNLYIADSWNNTILQWSPATQQMTTLVSTGLNHPHGVAVDAQGNVYIADTYNNAIEQWNPGTQQVTTLVSSGLNAPMGVAVDGQGNVYIADYGNNAIEQWNPTAQQFTTLVGTGLSNPTGVAVDLLGNVYFADFRNNAVKQWSPTNQQVTTLLYAGLSFPNAVAVDGQGNVYVVDGSHNALVEWSVANQAATTVVSSGMSGSFGVATDGQGNFYIANTSTSAILKFSSGYAGLGVTSLNEGPQAGADTVPVQGLGPSVPLVATSDQPWLNITGTAGGAISFSFQANTSVAGRVAHIAVLGQQVTVAQSGDTPAAIAKTSGDGQSTSVGQAFPAALQVTVTDAAGSPVQDAAVNFQVQPGPTGAAATFNATPPMPILTDQNGNATVPALTANGIPGQFSVTASAGTLNVTFTLVNSSYLLATASVVVASGAGSGTVLLIATGPWTAASNAGWLQISAGSTSGMGNSIIRFSYAANNTPATQTGTLTIAGLTFTVIQAGTSFVPTTLVTTLASGLNSPRGVALDAQGDVYIADTGNGVIREWSAATQQIGVVVSAGLNNPAGVAVDQYGNIYIADTGNNAIERWSVAGQQLNPLVSALSSPSGIATDAQGNVYFSNTGQNTIAEWNAASQQVNTLISTGLTNPAGIAVDGQGNVDFADTGNNAIKQWNPANQQVATLVQNGLNGPTGVAADGLGNVYFADTGNNAIRQWNAASLQLVTLPASGLNGPSGLAVDGQGNLYVADTNNGAVRRLSPAYVSLPTPSRSEGAPAGTDSVIVTVLPASTPLTATSDQAWLAITGVSGGVIGFSYQANTSVNSRTAHITVLSQQITVNQNGDVPAAIAITAGNGQSATIGQAYPIALQVTVTDAAGLPVQGAAVTFNVVSGASGAAALFAATPPMPILTDQNGQATSPSLMANTIGGSFTITASVNGLNATFNLTNLFYALQTPSATVGSTAGSGSVLVLATGPWIAASNAPWLTLVGGSTSGAASALVQFSYTANPNATSRTAALSISGLTFTVTQAGTGYVPVTLVQALVSMGLKYPQAVAVDTKGDVYIADTSNNAIREWSAATGLVNTLVSSGLSSPNGVAVDGQGNVYIADTSNNEIKMWNATSQKVNLLVSSGLISPVGVAVDSQGNVYFSDAGHNAIKEWIASTQQVTTLVSSGLNIPTGVAVDALGNIYIADSKNNAIKEKPVGKAVLTLVSGLNGPRGVGLDGQGYVYIADTVNNATKQWNPVSGQVVTLIASGLNHPSGVAVDGQGNVYIADTYDSAIKRFTAGYLALGSPSRNPEVPQAGTDSVTAAVLPATLPLTATSSQTWLKITGTSGGAITFSLTANTSATSRTAQITVLGQTVTVTQAADVPAAMSIIAGYNQSTPVGQAFATALEVRVKDAAGNGVSGVAVTFTVTAGSKGASGTFASSAPVVTNASGYATASTLTANNIAGTFTVTASAGNLSAKFFMTITSH